MLSNVSWEEYLAAVGTLLLLYYLVIGIRYYRKEIKNLLKGKIKTGDNTRSEKSAEEISFEELEAVVFDLRYAVLDKAGKNTSKPELLRQLAGRLEHYAGLRKPAYRAAINNAIIQHAKDSCGIVFTEEELNEAWVWYHRG